MTSTTCSRAEVRGANRRRPRLRTGGFFGHAVSCVCGT